MWWKNIKIKEIKVFGIGPFNHEFTYYIDNNNNFTIGKNGSGKTFLLKVIEFFFNENKYLKTIQTHDIINDIAHIQILFELNNEEVYVRKEISATKSSIKVIRTLYSRDDYPIEILNFIETAFVYFFSSERLLTEKDNEFDFIQNSITTKLLEGSEDDVDLLNNKATHIIDEYKNSVLTDLKGELDIKHSISFKTGLKVKLEWEEDPFKKLGSGQKKELALLILYGFIKARTKGPSLLLIDNIETHFDFFTLSKHINILSLLETSHQFVSTLSSKVIKSLVNLNYKGSVINKHSSSNMKIDETKDEDFLF